MTLQVPREVANGGGFGDFHFLHGAGRELREPEQNVKKSSPLRWLARCLGGPRLPPRGSSREPEVHPGPDSPALGFSPRSGPSLPRSRPLGGAHRFFHPSEQRPRRRKEHLWIDEQRGLQPGPCLSLPRPGPGGGGAAERGTGGPAGLPWGPVWSVVGGTGGCSRVGGVLPHALHQAHHPHPCLCLEEGEAGPLWKQPPLSSPLQPEEGAGAHPLLRRGN